MMLDAEKVLHVVALVCLWTGIVGHTVYRYPDKEPVPHSHPHQEHGQQQGYGGTDGGHHYSHPHRPRVYRPEPEQRQTQRSVPYGGCQYNGDILKNPRDRCSYLECHYGNEPWYDGQGKAHLYARVRQCPQGTAVAKDAKQVIFRPIQYDPTRRVHQGHGKGRKGYSGTKGYGNQGYGYHKSPMYEYKNTYEDMTPICSQMVDGYSCKGY